MEKFCKISMQPAKSSEQIHAHLKKYGCSLENVRKKSRQFQQKISKRKAKRVDSRLFKV